jgi:hypothetical protein
MNVVLARDNGPGVGVLVFIPNLDVLVGIPSGIDVAGILFSLDRLLSYKDSISNVF